jgi:hypothetical protein
MKINNIIASTLGVFPVEVKFIKETYEPDSEMEVTGALERISSIGFPVTLDLVYGIYSAQVHVQATTQGHAAHQVTEAMRNLQLKLSKGKFQRYKTGQIRQRKI